MIYYAFIYMPQTHTNTERERERERETEREREREREPIEIYMLQLIEILPSDRQLLMNPNHIPDILDILQDLHGQS